MSESTAYCNAIQCDNEDICKFKVLDELATHRTTFVPAFTNEHCPHFTPADDEKCT